MRNIVLNIAESWNRTKVSNYSITHKHKNIAFESKFKHSDVHFAYKRMDEVKI